MVRSLGMGKSKGYYTAPISNKGHHLHDINHTDVEIETILDAQYKNAVKLLKDNIPFLMEVTEELLDKSNLLPEEFKEIADKYVQDGIKIISAKDTMEQPFNEKLQDFKMKHDVVSVQLSKIKKARV